MRRESESGVISHGEKKISGPPLGYWAIRLLGPASTRAQSYGLLTAVHCAASLYATLHIAGDTTLNL